MSAFGKMALLLTSKAKQQYAGQTSHHLWQILLAGEATIKSTLQTVPRGYILVTDVHASKSDSRPHFTVDAYGQDSNGHDKPIGCIHMYEDDTFWVYDTPRSKAWTAYVKKSKGSP